MAEDEFHVHGPHDHELEHASQRGGGDSFTGRIAVTTALLATVGALFSYQGVQRKPMPVWRRITPRSRKPRLPINEITIKPRAANRIWPNWASSWRPVAKEDHYTQAIERYKEEKADIKKNAEKFESESKEWDDKSDQLMDFAPSLGASHDSAADCDSFVRDRFADAKKMAAVGCIWFKRFWDRLGRNGSRTPLKWKAVLPSFNCEAQKQNASLGHKRCSTIHTHKIQDSPSEVAVCAT